MSKPAFRIYFNNNKQWFNVYEIARSNGLVIKRRQTNAVSEAQAENNVRHVLYGKALPDELMVCFEVVVPGSDRDVRLYRAMVAIRSLSFSEPAVHETALFQLSFI